MKKIFFITLILYILLFTGCDSKKGSKTKDLTRGTWINNEFISEFANLKFNMPDNWLKGSDDEIAALMGVAVDMLSDRGMKVSGKMLELTTIYDMAAQNPSNRNSVIFMYENLAVHIGGSQFTETFYLERVKEMLDTLEMGYSFSDIRDTAIAGEIFNTLETTINNYGFTQFYHARKIENYMFVIIITVNIGSDGMISCFSKL